MWRVLGIRVSAICESEGQYGPQSHRSLNTRRPQCFTAPVYLVQSVCNLTTFFLENHLIQRRPLRLCCAPSVCSVDSGYDPLETPAVCCLCSCSNEEPAVTSLTVRGSSLSVASEWWKVGFSAFVLCLVGGRGGRREAFSVVAH